MPYNCKDLNEIYKKAWDNFSTKDIEELSRITKRLVECQKAYETYRELWNNYVKEELQDDSKLLKY